MGTSPRQAAIDMARGLSCFIKPTYGGVKASRQLSINLEGMGWFGRPATKLIPRGG
jgi:hypothetical protein